MLAFTKDVLKNKLELYTVGVNEKSEVISVDIFYKVGSRDEKMGLSGIAHMLEHLNFKSTKNLKEGEFDKIIKDFGGVDNASTGFDYTHYFIKCHKDNLDKSLWLFAELMQNLTLSEEEFLKERNVVLEERRWRTDNSPLGYLFFSLYNNAFHHHPYHWTPIGFYQDIQNWELEDIRNFHEDFYQPQNAFILITGTLNHKEALSLCKKHFENIENKGSIPRVKISEGKQLGPRKAVVHKPSKNELLALGYKIPNFSHEDMPALQALSEYLGSGKSSKISKILIDELNLINDYYAYASSCKDENLFVFILVCNENVKAKDAKIELLKIIDEVKTKLLSDKDLEKIKNNTKAELIYSQENASKVASLYGSYLANGDLRPLLDYEENIKNLKAFTLQEVAKRYFIKDSSTTVILKGEENG